MGSALIYLVQVDEDREIEVRAPRTEAALAIQAGAQVLVSWQPSNAVVVPDDNPEARGAEGDLSTQVLLKP